MELLQCGGGEFSTFSSVNFFPHFKLYAINKKLLGHKLPSCVILKRN